MSYEKYKFLIEAAEGDRVKLKLVSALISLAEYPEASTLEKYEVAQYLDKAIRLAKDTVNELTVSQALPRKPSDPTLEEVTALIRGSLKEGDEIIVVSPTLDPHAFQAVIIESGMLMRKEYTFKDRNPVNLGKPNG